MTNSLFWTCSLCLGLNNSHYCLVSSRVTMWVATSTWAAPSIKCFYLLLLLGVNGSLVRREGKRFQKWHTDTETGCTHPLAMPRSCIFKPELIGNRIQQDSHEKKYLLYCSQWLTLTFSWDEKVLKLSWRQREREEEGIKQENDRKRGTKDHSN